MKKTNRVAGNGDTARTHAQAKRRETKAATSIAAHKKTPHATSLPCHRLAPRTAAQTRELQTFTANLGLCQATCVFASGDVQHLFQRASGQFFLVTEALNVAGPGGRRLGLSDALWHDRVSLADYVKRRKGLIFGRVFDFESLSEEEAALWAEEKEVAEGLPLDVKRFLWGDAEADGMTKGRMILSAVRTSDGGGDKIIWARCGSFILEDEETGEERPITRDDVIFRVRNFCVLPLLDSKVPRGFRGDFALACRSEREVDYPADPADVLAA